MNDQKNETLWTQTNGKPIEERDLKKRCQSWSADTWEEFLKDTVDIEAKEMLLEEPEMIEYYSTEDHEDFIEGHLTPQEFPRLKQVMLNLLKEMPKKQQMVLELLFWEGKNLQEAADELGISRPSTFRLRNRALNSFTKLLLSSFGKTANEVCETKNLVTGGNKGNEITIGRGI